MRKIIIIQFITILAALSLSAQERSDFNAVTDPITKEPAVVSGHSIQLSIFGLEYSYEQPLGGYWSIIGRVGLSSSLTDYSVTYDLSSYNTSKNYSFNWSPSLGVTVEPRYYTSMRRRFDKGRKTVNNSSDFVSLQVKAYDLASDDGIQLSAIAAYGIRRGGEHWFREYTGGVAFHTIYGGVLPHLGFKFGYRF